MKRCTGCNVILANQDVTECDVCFSCKMRAEVDAMPLGRLLSACIKSIQVNRAFPTIIKSIREEFVTQLHKRKLVYHFDDCAIDCLVDTNQTGVTREEAELINQIVKLIYHDDMFILAMKLNGEVIDP